MKLKLYQVDAFTEKIFGGNPAAICPLEEWISDDLMQKIALENNLAETAFYVLKNNVYQIRWFTPAVEVDLCGHATLAAAHVIYNYGKHTGDIIHFHSHRSGDLFVTRQNDLLTLDFPTDIIQPIEITENIKNCFEDLPIAAYKGKTDYLVLFSTEEQIQEMKPRYKEIALLPIRGLIVSAPGNQVDFVSRFFGPQSGIDEDPVTGSAHTTLIPYWHSILGKKEMTALQISPRRGSLVCTYKGDRVLIGGQSALYMIGEIYV